jgi:hypothetical protein
MYSEVNVSSDYVIHLLCVLVEASVCYRGSMASRGCVFYALLFGLLGEGSPYPWADLMLFHELEWSN